MLVHYLPLHIGKIATLPIVLKSARLAPIDIESTKSILLNSTRAIFSAYSLRFNGMMLDRADGRSAEHRKASQSIETTT